MEKWLTAAEVVALNLQYLPSTKAGVIAKAKREGWETTERSGNGGVTKLYKVPQHYSADGSAPLNRKITLYAAQQAVEQAYKMAQIVGDVDVKKFMEMFTTLCKTEQEPQPSMSHNTQRAKAGKQSTIQQGNGNNINAKTIKGDIKL